MLGQSQKPLNSRSLTVLLLMPHLWKDMYPWLDTLKWHSCCSPQKPHTQNPTGFFALCWHGEEEWSLHQHPAKQAGGSLERQGALERALKLGPSLLGEDTTNGQLQANNNVTSSCWFWEVAASLLCFSSAKGSDKMHTQLPQVNVLFSLDQAMKALPCWK